MFVFVYIPGGSKQRIAEGRKAKNTLVDGANRANDVDDFGFTAVSVYSTESVESAQV